MANGRIVYQAPSEADEVFDLLVWYNLSTDRYIAIPIILKCEADEISLSAEKIEGEHSPVYRVPTASNSGVIMFVMQRSQGDGFSICLPGRPLNPRPSRCAGGNFTEVREKMFLRCDPWWVACQIFVDATLAAEIRRRFGILVRANLLYDIRHRKCTRTKLRIVDCYECRNCVPVYVGTRVFYWRRVWFEVDPAGWGAWLCPPPRPKFKSGCVYSGQCPCP